MEKSMTTTTQSSLTRFRGAKSKKETKFVGEKLEIVKLTVAQAMTIQEKVAASDAEDPEANLKILLLVLQEGAPDLAELTMDDLKSFSMVDLTALSTEIMKYSGMSGEK